MVQSSDIVEAHGLKFQLMLSEAAIAQRVREMALELQRDYADKKPLLLGLLNGAFIFAADLVRQCTFPLEISFVRVSSYDGLQSSGRLTTHFGPDLELRGRHVLLVEDIIDSGQTLHQFLPQLQSLQPASLRVAVLLVKPEALECEVPLDYVGFEIPNKFVIGYGLDYDGLGRNLPGIYQLKE